MARGNTRACLKEYEKSRHELEIFCDSVHKFFQGHPRLASPPPIVHSVRSRLKDPEHLRQKLRRNGDGTRPITPKNLFKRVTDLAGVRVLHLYRDQCAEIHRAILEKVNRGDWHLEEKPRAFTWDPEAVAFFKGLGLSTEYRETQYTSIHYLVRPRRDSPLCCEIQVRTLFEEVWGEIDHTINYPEKTKSLACAEQLRVLSKLVGAGTRLADAIFRSHREHLARQRGARPTR
jgi:ppGpp synthetase/RelA/SpoT-type nucleotidyltranferase